MSAPVDRVEPAHRSRSGVARVAAAIAAAMLAMAIAARYPLAPALLIALLLAYAAALWRWPPLFLAVVPAALAGCDLGIWTGWTVVEEPDLVVLVTIAVLLVRAPPGRADLVLRGLSGAALALAAAAAVVGVAMALARADMTARSAIAEIDPLNALRVAKGFAIALVLLPFLRGARRRRADALWLLAAGMAAGLALVAAATLYERIVFTGPFDFAVAYRVVGTFSSMHFGGGYIGIFVAMALPFLFVPPPRARRAASAGFALVAVGALYTLVVTFARAAYASAIVASLVAAAGRGFVAVRRGERAGAIALPLALLVAVGIVLAVAAENARFMERRIDHLLPDLDARLREWRGGLRLRDPGPVTALFGMGLGIYARTVLERRPGGRYPTDVALATEDGRNFLRVRAGLPLYLGQKVTVAPLRIYRFSALVRTRDRGALVVILCEKLLLYAGNCRDIEFAPQATGAWQPVDSVLPSFGLGLRSVLGLRRPVELALLVPGAGTSLDIADVRLTDVGGREVLVNGDFARGLDRWLPTDDNHAIWRIENQYLTTLFETGALGLGALLLLAAVALRGAARAAARGDAMAPALAGAIAAVLASSLFDCPLEVPRLAALFYLVAFAALAIGDDAMPRDRTT
jgi:O-antigen ligase